MKFFFSSRHCGDSFPRRKISTTKYGQTHLMMLKWDTKTVSGGQQEGGFKIKANAYRVYGIQSEGIDITMLFSFR